MLLLKSEGFPFWFENLEPLCLEATDFRLKKLFRFLGGKKEEQLVVVETQQGGGFGSSTGLNGVAESAEIAFSSKFDYRVEARRARCAFRPMPRRVAIQLEIWANPSPDEWDFSTNAAVFTFLSKVSSVGPDLASWEPFSVSVSRLHSRWTGSVNATALGRIYRFLKLPTRADSPLRGFPSQRFNSKISRMRSAD